MKYLGLSDKMADWRCRCDRGLLTAEERNRKNGKAGSKLRGKKERGNPTLTNHGYNHVGYGVGENQWSGPMVVITLIAIV